jgi:transcription-repair coupling factor (superfamily II helicase)
VTRYDERVIRDAILREVERGGQVFFLHNRVETIDRLALKLADLIPEARMTVAHGQMRPKELEKVMVDFLDNKTQVLVCSAIIESGLDFPNANTIIINRADQFGLAQLYQLRGRVGRSHRHAFAYLLIPGEKAITPDAERRLRALQEIDGLGGGFKLALHDLEIRAPFARSRNLARSPQASTYREMEKRCRARRGHRSTGDSPGIRLFT